MGGASVSVIQGGLHILPKFDTRLGRIPSISSQLQSRDSARVRFLLYPIRFLTGSNSARAHNLPIRSSKSTKEEDGISTASEYRTRKKPGDGTIGKSNPSASKGSSEVESDEAERFASAVKTVALCVSSAVLFGIGVGLKQGVGKASEFFAGYLLEQSLSVDNLFVFVLVFKYFKVPVTYQSRVLSYGIAGAIIFRSILILLGTATIQSFEAVSLLFAAILLYSAFKLFAEDEEEEDLSDNFVVKTCQKLIPVTASYDGNKFFTLQDAVWKATPLLLTTVVIELSDIAFAVDSIPAVFGVTRDPFIVLSSNMFAILGLRSLYTLISEGMSQLEYLQPSIAVVLGFIGSKMILDFFGYHVSTEASLGFVATSLTLGVVFSLLKKSED